MKKTALIIICFVVGAIAGCGQNFEWFPSSSGGVPFFYNLQTKKFICGEDSYENLKKWAKGEKFEQGE